MGSTKLNLQPVQGDLDLGLIIKVLKKWKLLIMALTLLITLAAGLYSYYVIEPVYQSKTLLMVTVASEKLQVSNAQQLLNRQNEEGSAPMPVLTMNTYLGQLQSEELIKRVQANLGLTGQPIGVLSSKIDAGIIEDSNLIEVWVEDTDPVKAQAIAEAVSTEYLELMREFMFSSVVVISPANVPTGPIKPNKKMNIAMAFVVGLTLSTVLAFLLNYLDNIVKTPEDIKMELDMPVLGVIPLQTGKSMKQYGYGDNL